MNTTPFMDTFNSFFNEIIKVIPDTHKSGLMTIQYFIKFQHEEKIMVDFFNECHKHKTNILMKNDTYIYKLKNEFPFLDIYDSINDKQTKECILEYIQILYLLAYKEIEKMNV